MSGGAIAGFGVLGLSLGMFAAVPIDRVPPRTPLLRRPFDEVGAALRNPAGCAVIMATGAVFAAMAARFERGWVLAAYLVLAIALIVLSAIDLRHFILPNRIVGPLTIAMIVLFGVAAIAIDDVDPLLRALACAAGAFLAFLVMHLISPRAMGFGDVKLSFVLGLGLGWLGVGETVLGLFLGFVYGAVLGLTLIVTGIRSRKDHVPFGPFLALGAITAILIGDTILDWYRG